MSDSHAITTAAPAEVQRQYKQAEIHPLAAAAMSNNIDTEKLEKLMALQERHEANEAKKAFTEAMVELKAELPTVIGHDRDGYDKRYTYTSAAKAVTEIVPILTKHGFSHAWIPLTKDKLVRVTCRIMHRDGHFEETYLEAPPDKSGSKSDAQAICSTQTLLSRYTFLGLLGIATADMKDPTGPSQTDMEHVDNDKNMKAVSWLKSQGVRLEEAENHVQRGWQQWTLGDLGQLKGLGKSKQEKQK